MAETIYGVFIDASMAEKAVGALLDRGAKSEDITVISGSLDTSTISEAVVYERGDGVSALSVVQESVDNSAEDAYHAETAGKRGISTTTSRDAETGAIKGAEIGLGLGVLAGMAALFVPGFGIVIGGGALATALGATLGATAAGAVAGGVTGYLVDQGVPEIAAEEYHHEYTSGAAILTVDIPSGALNGSEVEAILLKYNAERVRVYENVATEPQRVAT